MRFYSKITQRYDFFSKIANENSKDCKEKKEFLRPANRNKGHTATQPYLKRKKPLNLSTEGLSLKKWRLPTLPRVCSTIGAGRLNFSVRNGKRWNPATITT